MFSKILIANRGEIACRVIKTARRLGIKTVAVYSEADANARHVALADEAYLIGPAPARESYLVAAKILEAAKRSGAEAIHPGYGFLSENAAFAQACAEAGVTFIGPPPDAIRAMGSKSAAKAAMERSGVPLVPGYHGTDQDPEKLAASAARIGFPVLIKASAGGGGKGMRVVERAEDFAGALASAKREAAASFGDDQVLIEKYLTKPRHIEIQVFADTHGNVVSLFERDCSIQRRHQKVIEEAPAPGMDPARRRDMGEAACTAARAIGYVGAGTVEFIAEGGNFYFMEMNTRLQVEHPVTEAITGQDLVEWQLRVASGERLPQSQDTLTINGHAIEVRIYAEDPGRDFLPSIGTLMHLNAPSENAHVRVDTGVRQGDAITVNYDPMIAKLIVWDETREAAAQRMSAALADYEIVGVTTNIAFLKALIDHPAFRSAALDTGFIARHNADLFPASAAIPEPVLAAATMRLVADNHAEVARAAALSGDPHSPWNTTTAWRMNGEGYQDFVLKAGDKTLTVRAHPQTGGGCLLDLPDGTKHVMLEGVASDALVLDGVRRRVTVVRAGSEVTVLFAGASYGFSYVDPRAPEESESAGAGHLKAPMPGRVTHVFVAAGDEAKRGQALMIMEAMKMELTISAPMDGVISSVCYAAGDLVDEGAELITFEEEE